MGAKHFSLKTGPPEAKNKRFSSQTSSYKQPSVSLINICVNNDSNIQHQLLVYIIETFLTMKNNNPVTIALFFLSL